jgi:hypothetical protein
MMFGMPPSDHHRFYLTTSDTVVELRWRAPERRPSRGVAALFAALFSRARTDPRTSVDHRAFDAAADLLATDATKALQAFAALGYDVETTVNDYQAAA